jgi:hypothetical protein
MKHTLEKIFTIFCVLILLSSCYNKNDFNFVKFETKIDNDTIKSIEFDRSIVKLASYYLMDNCQFIYKDTFPNWIKDFSKPQLSEVFNKKKTFLKLADCCAKSPDFVPIPIGKKRWQPAQVLKIIA